MTAAAEPPAAEPCPNPLHDHPLPSGYIAASEVAEQRLRKRWANVRCPDCGLYGWRPRQRRPAVAELPDDEFLSGLRSDEAIKGTPHRMVPGSHERPGSAECACGGTWDRWSGQCVNQGEGTAQ